MRIIKIIFSIFKREFLLNIRNVFDLLSIILFFFLGILIFVLSIGPSQDIIKKISIGIIWSLLLLSSTLSMKKIFQEDFNNGNMIIFYISGIALEFVVLVKIFASWILFYFPFLIALPLSAIILDVENAKYLPLFITFLIGSLAITNITSMAGSMNLLNKKNFTLGSLIIMFFSIPIIIFSVNIINSPIELYYAQIKILCGILFLFLAITPWVCAGCIKIAIKNI